MLAWPGLHTSGIAWASYWPCATVVAYAAALDLAGRRVGAVALDQPVPVRAVDSAGARVALHVADQVVTLVRSDVHKVEVSVLVEVPEVCNEVVPLLTRAVAVAGDPQRTRGVAARRHV